MNILSPSEILYSYPLCLVWFLKNIKGSEHLIFHGSLTFVYFSLTIRIKGFVFGSHWHPEKCSKAQHQYLTLTCFSWLTDFSQFLVTKVNKVLMLGLKFCLGSNSYSPALVFDHDLYFMVH